MSCRLIYDPATGKPRGFGFCEYKDPQTASSAVRNLAGREVNGRPLRIDSATNAPGGEGSKGPSPPVGGGQTEVYTQNRVHCNYSIARMSPGQGITLCRVVTLSEKSSL